MRPEDRDEGHSEIPWQQIISQRNVLAHEYGEFRQLEPLLPPTPNL